jgi:hypothetical protein
MNNSDKLKGRQTDKRFIMGEVMRELDRAQRRFEPFYSAHEGYAVIKEELDELWEEIKDNKRDLHEYKDAMAKEALQLTAMGLRFLVDLDQMRGGALQGERNDTN